MSFDDTLFYGPRDIFNERQRLEYNTTLAQSCDTSLSVTTRSQKKLSARKKMWKCTRDHLHPEDALLREANRAVGGVAWRAKQKLLLNDGDENAVKARESAITRGRARYQVEKSARAAGDVNALAAYATQVDKSRIQSVGQNAKRRHKKHEELSALFKSIDGSVSTEFGLGEDSRSDEINERVHDIMKSSAGVLHPKGEATSDNWVRDHGEYTSLENLISQGVWAAYFLVTMTIITPGEEIKCNETTAFLPEVQRNPLWRIEAPDGDLKRFTTSEAKSIVCSYLLADCVSAYDVTSLEKGCQLYCENELNMPHGMCLHKNIGAGARMQYSTTPQEKKRIANGEACEYSLVLSLIKTDARTFADSSPDDPGDRPPPLTSCSVTSHDGKMTYNVSVRGYKQSFPDTESVKADKARIQRYKGTTTERRLKRKKPCDAEEDVLCPLEQV
ncbi:hypothetical protein T484DRAFT_1758175 [Baffinella frigidus]|nr:hypothetical protein T484DRAFT_1758175 [Cryptophyta sp. CCMP2293]